MSVRARIRRWEEQGMLTKVKEIAPAVLAALRCPQAGQPTAMGARVACGAGAPAS